MVTMLIDNFIDIELFGPSIVYQLYITIRKSMYSISFSFLLKNREPEEYHITSVPLAMFNSWTKFYPDFALSLQYISGILVVNVMLLLYEGAADIITTHIVKVVNRIYLQNNAEVWPRSRYTLFDFHLFFFLSIVTNLMNEIRKNNDAHIYSSRQLHTILSKSCN